jgi:hypothetical protein
VAGGTPPRLRVVRFEGEHAERAYQMAHDIVATYRPPSVSQERQALGVYDKLVAIGEPRGERINGVEFLTLRPDADPFVELTEAERDLLLAEVRSFKPPTIGIRVKDALVEALENAGQAEGAAAEAAG